MYKKLFNIIDDNYKFIATTKLPKYIILLHNISIEMLHLAFECCNIRSFLQICLYTNMIHPLPFLKNKIPTNNRLIIAYACKQNSKARNKYCAMHNYL